MKNPIIDGKHLREYVGFGLIAAIAYMVPVIIFLTHNKFENLYYLYLGCFLFMATIFCYGYKLLYRHYDKNRATSMLISSILTSLAGVLIAVILVVASMFYFFPDLFTSMPTGEVIKNAPATNPTKRPSGLLLMILATATIGNFGVGAFISVIVTYAGKLDQTKDKPTPLEKHVQAAE